MDVVVLIPHWNDKEETMRRVLNALAQSIPVTPLVMNWGKGSFPDSVETMTTTLEQTVNALSCDYVQFLTPGATLAPTKIEDCLNSSIRPMYLDAQNQSGQIVGIDRSQGNLQILEMVATGAVALTIDAALFSRPLMVQLVNSLPQGVSRMGRRILGGADRWLLLDALAYADYPLTSERVSSTVPAIKQTGLSSSYLAQKAISELLYRHRSIIQYRQASGFNALIQNSRWDWESMAFLEQELSGRVLLIGCPDWLPNALPRCSCDVAVGVEQLPSHYEYYWQHFTALVSENPERDERVWGETLKSSALIVSWIEQANWEQHGGIWVKRISQ